jgi:hypothetical protein
VNAQFRCQRANGREGLPGTELAAENGFLRSEDHLRKDGFTRTKRDFE